MSAPVCDACANSLYLCTECERLLADSAINEYDVEVARALAELTQGAVSFRRAIETQDYVIVIAGEDDVGGIIGRDGANIKALSSRIGRNVRVVGDGDFEELVKAFIAPARVKGINKVFDKGSQRIRVHVDSRDRDRLRITQADLGRLIAGLAEGEVELLFD